MKENIINQRVSKTLKFSEIFNDAGEFSGGGILNPTDEIEEEIWVELTNDFVLDPKDEQWKSTGRIQIHLGSTKEALEELGTFILALARYSPPKPGYTASFEFNDKYGKPIVHLVLHMPTDITNKQENFPHIYNVASAVISRDGTQIIETTLPPREPD